MNILLRRATIEDAKFLFKLRTDPLSKKYSHNKSPIYYPDHCAWLKKSLCDTNRTIFIVESKEGISVGMVRVDLIDNHYVLSWAVTANSRGLGIGLEMVKAALLLFKGPFLAEVKQENIASIKIAERSGMTKIKDCNDVITFKKY